MADNSLEVKIKADITDLQTKMAIAQAVDKQMLASVRDLAKGYVQASEEMKTAARAQLEAAVEAAAKQAEVMDGLKAKIAADNAAIIKAQNEAAEASKSGFAKMVEGIEGTTRSVEELTEKFMLFSRAGAAISELVLAGLGLEKLGEAIKSVAETGDQIGQFAEKTGLAATEVSGLRVVAGETDTAMDDVGTGLKNLAKNMETALAEPTGKAAQQFRELGVSVRDASTGAALPFSDVLEQVAERFASFDDGAAKAADAGDMFGSKIGTNLIPFLNQLGAVTIPVAAQRAADMGVSFDDAATAADTHFLQATKDVGFSLEGFRDIVVQGALPGLANLEASCTSAASGMSVTNGAALTLDYGFRALIEAVGLAAAAFEVVWDQLILAGQEMGSLINMSRALALAMEGDFSQAAEVVESSAAAMAQSYHDEVAKMEADTQNFANLHNELWNGMQVAPIAPPPPPAGPAPDLAGGAGVGRGGHQGVGSDPALDGLNSDDSGADDDGGSGRVSAARSAQNDITQIAQNAAEARKEIQASELQAQISNWGAEVAQGRMSKAQELQDEMAAQGQIYEAALAEMQKEVALAPMGSLARAKALDDEQVMMAQHVAEMAQLNEQLVQAQVEAANAKAEAEQQAAQKAQEAWQRAIQPIETATDGMLNGILQGTQTLRGAEIKAAQDITLAFIDAEAKKALSFAASEAQILARGVLTQTGLTAATLSGNATRVAAQTTANATSKALQATDVTSSLAGSAAKAAGEAYAALAGVPIVGPALGAAAAAASYTAVLAYDVLSAEGGLALGPGMNPLVQLHENETVLPAYIAQPLTALATSGDVFNQSGGNSSTTHNFNTTINAGRGGVSPDDVLSALESAARSGFPAKYSALNRMMRRGS